ncbi:response regulator [Actinosynnema sp. CS-041913]|uniref:response regulator n=1 Tax=Actinosynnema sp. CS-041913 TaxID=3239917 RepID=UPI003D93E8B8
MIRVVVVDDEALVRGGVRALLDSAPDTELVGEGADGDAGVAVVRETVPDVVLLDVRMPGTSGLAALRAITADPALVAVRVVMLTVFDLDEYVFDALSHGADGFVLKDVEPAEMLRAIRVVADGQSVLSPAVTRGVIARLSRTAAVHPEIRRLTRREREVAGWAATGMSNHEIAERLSVSSETVRTHIGRAMLKLHARDRAQLVVYAIQSGLGPSAPARRSG